MANFLANLLSTGAGSLVEAVGDSLDKSFGNDEELRELDDELAKASMQYEVEMTSRGLEEKQADPDDIDSARGYQSQVRESEHTSWLERNVHSMLAVGIIGLTFALYFCIIKGDMSKIADKGVKDIVIYILGALTTISTQVAAFYFGSSQGSKDKQKSIADFTANISRRS